MRIFLDMDEVITDFVGGALRIHGWTRARLEAVWPVGSWSIVEPMGLTAEQFWQPINAAGESFWLGLQPLPWARSLVTWVFARTDDWYIVSSPSQSTAAYAGKIHWLRRYFGRGFDRYIITQHKHLLARPGTLLIDDRAESVDQFAAAGGNAVLFPSRHNRLYAHAHDPVLYLSQLFSGANLCT